MVDRKRRLDCANGIRKADIVLKHGKVLNVFTEEILEADVAICGDTIVGVGSYEGEREIDCTGKYLVPGFLDAHMHIESSMVSPGELSKVLVQAGTTTIVADPHEIVNVCGVKGLDYFLKCAGKALVHIFFMIPSSVPATDVETNGNADGIEKTIEEIKKDTKGLIFTNLVDTDMLYGHRNNIEGYARALEYFDSKLPEIMSKMKENDMLILTGDHGNDPSTPSTDHSREYTPILVYGKNIKENVNLGIRSTFADISATILDMLDLPKLENGISFRKEIEK